MKQLPKEEVPLKNSSAAVKMERQLRRQLPVADFLLEANTSLKTQEEIIAYKQFAKDRDENACSVGLVTSAKQDMVCENTLLLVAIRSYKVILIRFVYSFILGLMN